MSKDEQWLLTEKYAGIASEAFSTDCTRLARGEPLAYVIGTQPFLGLTIHLDSHPLIPRPETEWWVNTLLADTTHTRTTAFNFLDLCAGSGAIGCAALAQLPRATVFFGDCDPLHEATILKNIRENHLDESRAHIRSGDLCAPFPGMRFDVIAANPPYIPLKRVLDRSVTDYEPPIALRSGPLGLNLMRRIADALPHVLTPTGTAWIECDSAHAHEAASLFQSNDLTARICTDQYKIERYLVISFTHTEP